MATTEFFSARPATAGDRFRQTAAAVLAMGAAALVRVSEVVRAMHNRRSVGRLLAWDDRMLRDIGLTPGDVRSAMALPIAEDPSQRLGALSVERRAAERAAALERLRDARLRAKSAGLLEI